MLILAIIGIGMLGVIALYAGIEPAGGDVNNLIPQMAATYLSPLLLCVFFVMIIGSLSCIPIGSSRRRRITSP